MVFSVCFPVVRLIRSAFHVRLGILTVVVIKIIILKTCRCALYTAFYRKRPASANITAVALECSNFALSVGFVFLRMIKFLITAAIFIGRVSATSECYGLRFAKLILTTE